MSGGVVSGNTFLAVFNRARAQGNELGDDGAKAWAGVLLLNTTLTSVDLGRELIVQMPSINLCKSSCCAAQFSSCSANSIGDDGVNALADMLKRNTSLTSIGLSSKSESWPRESCRHSPSSVFLFLLKKLA